MAFYCNGSVAAGYYHDLSAYNNIGSSRQLMMGWLRIPATDASYRRIFHTHFLQSASTDSLQLTKLNNNKLVIARGDSTGTGYGVASDATLVADTWYHIIAHGGLGINPKLWINGVAQSGSSTTALGIGTRNSRLYIGMRSGQDAPFKGDLCGINYWISNNAVEVPAPTDKEAMMFYRSQNPWGWNPSELRIASPLRALDQPAIYLGTGAGAAVKVGTPTQSTEHAPITSANISFISSSGAGGSDTDISGTLESITLTENTATTALDISVAAALESLLLSEFQSSVATDISLSGTLELIQILESAADIAVDVSITGTQEQIEVTQNPASLGLGISASAEPITLSTFVAGVSLDRSISGTLETIQITGNAASVATGLNATTETIVLTENQATVQLDTAITASLETIVLNELAAQVDLGANISANLESVTLTESGATIIFDSGISATLESISLSTLRATITSSTLAPTVPGLEYTMSGDRLHYTLPVNRLHFTFKREN